MSDLIRRSDAIAKTFCTDVSGFPRMVVLLDDIKNAPTVTADRPKGKWKVIKKNINTTLVSCSECGKRFHIPNYCFDCGADMRPKGDDDA